MPEYDGQYTSDHLKAIYNILSLIYSELGFSAKALDQLTLALEIDSNYDEALYNKGIIQFQNNELKKASQAFQKVVNIRPDYFEAINNLGISELNLNLLDESYGSLCKAVETAEKNTNESAILSILYSNLGNVCRIKEHYEEAIGWFTKAINLAPLNANYYKNRGGCNHLKYHFQLALDDYNKALTLNPDDIETNINRAQLYIFDHNYYKAMEDILEIFSYCQREGKYDDIYKFSNDLYLYCQHWLWSLAIATKDFIAAIEVLPGLKNLSKTKPNLDIKLFDPFALNDLTSKEYFFIYNTINKLQPDDPLKDMITLALFFMKSEDYDNVTVQLHRACPLAPIGSQLRQFLFYWNARIFEVKLEKLDDAITEITTLIKTERKYIDKLSIHEENLSKLQLQLSDYLTYLGYLLELKDIDEEALECYQSALTYNTDNLYAILNHAYLLVRIGNFQPAINDFIKSINIKIGEYTDNTLILSGKTLLSALKEYEALLKQSTLEIPRLNKAQGKLAKIIQEIKKIVEIVDDVTYETKHKEMDEKLNEKTQNYIDIINNNVTQTPKTLARQTIENRK